MNRGQTEVRPCDTSQGGTFSEWYAGQCDPQGHQQMFNWGGFAFMAGDEVLLRTSVHPWNVRGVILEIDHGATYPVIMDLYLNDGSKVRSRFRHEEFEFFGWAKPAPYCWVTVK